MTAELKRIWMEAFGDSAETVDKFFVTGYSPKRCNYLCRDGIPTTALYWFDCFVENHKIAYIYGVATAKDHRGQGLASQLLADTHRRLQENGYAGAILVPGEPGLFALYQKLGYRPATKIGEFSCLRGDTPAEITPIGPEEYAALRRAYLPNGGVVQEAKILEYLQTYAAFYKGPDFLLSATADGEILTAQELLGNTQAAPGILQALGCSRGQFRTPGETRDFAMFLPFSTDCPHPGYFGLALD